MTRFEQSQLDLHCFQRRLFWSTGLMGLTSGFHEKQSVSARTTTSVVRSRGLGGGGGGGGNLGVILVRVCEPVFQNLPHSYTWPLKKRTHSYT